MDRSRRVVGENWKTLFTSLRGLITLLTAVLLVSSACTENTQSVPEGKEDKRGPQQTSYDYSIPTEKPSSLAGAPQTLDLATPTTKTGPASSTVSEPSSVQVPVPLAVPAPPATPVLAAPPEASLNETPMVGAVDISLGRFRLETSILPSNQGQINSIPASEDRTYRSGTVVDVTARCEGEFLSWSGVLPE